MKILFACVGNSCRSQMAEGFARFLASEAIEVFSAGAKPEQRVSPEAIAVMREVGIDISHSHPKNLTALPTLEFDLVVTMGCGTLQRACPTIRADREVSWAIQDPLGRSLQTFRRTRDEILSTVEMLFRELQSIGAGK